MCKIIKSEVILERFYVIFFSNRLNVWMLFAFSSSYTRTRMMCSKPSSFCGNEPSLNSYDIVWIFNDYNDVIFTWIIYARYMSIGNNIMYLILKLVLLSLANTLPRLKDNVVILDRLYLVILFLNALLIIFLHLFCKLLSNMRKHTTAVLPKFFLFLTVDRKTICYTYPPHIVIVVFLWGFWPTQKVRFQNETFQMILFSVVFWQTKVLYNMSSLSGYMEFMYPAHFPRTRPRLAVYSHNVHIYCVNGNWQQKALNYIFVLNEDMGFYKPKGS